MSEEIRYAAVWEDADVLCAALEPVAAGGRLLSIASAGDNALALLTLDPEEVVAVDRNPAQLACLALRVAAFRRLETSELWAFLGVTHATNRLGTYHQLRGDLPTAARGFWDARPAAVRRGIIQAGRFEAYLRLFRRAVLPLIHPRHRVERLLTPMPPAARESFYRREWDTPRWRAFGRVFFSRAVMSRLGRDPACFAHVEGSIGDHILRRCRDAVLDHAAPSNPYLAFVLLGGYQHRSLPRYLRADQVPVIRARLDRLRLVEGEIAAVTGGPFHGFNLSDIFEYMAPAEHAGCYRSLLRLAAPCARLVYWNMMVPRGCPLPEEAGVRADAPLAVALHRADRVWFYRELHVDQLLPARQELASSRMEVTSS